MSCRILPNISQKRKYSASFEGELADIYMLCTILDDTTMKINIKQINMKKTILILTFAILGLTNLKAQTSFSCTYRQYCTWNKVTEKFGNCTGYEESSLF